MVRRWFDTVITYLTLLSALALPVVLLGWGRSFIVYDRVFRANGGWALLGSSHNGELTLWSAETHPSVSVFAHRARDSSPGFTARRAFDRMGADKHFWLLGFGHATADRMPGRFPYLMGEASAWVVPYWGVAVLCGILPFWLIVKQAEPYRPPPEEMPEPTETEAPDAPAFQPAPPAPAGYGAFPSRRPPRIAAMGDRRWR